MTSADQQTRGTRPPNSRQNVAERTHRGAHFLGFLSVCASSVLWWVTLNRITSGFLDHAFPFILLLALVLPAIAGWRASKLWLYMILSPVLHYVFVLFHIC
jgi:hypothetical protein